MFVSIAVSAVQLFPSKSHVSIYMGKYMLAVGGIYADASDSINQLQGIHRQLSTRLILQLPVVIIVIDNRMESLLLNSRVIEKIKTAKTRDECHTAVRILISLADRLELVGLVRFKPIR